ncbi:GGDEF domain-containing protein [Vibrio fluvialis]|uniref:diguanylate cyclase n=1 Tax=Vibrio fluvialis PG41 TaxID=1336752 RepID=S7JIC7_VIBFL|nr:MULTISPECIES: GGDEF domain-containing protein [Vibrio]EKO3390964.1 GGDEF domain-containing protein [Vibrio fluvialis]EKO3408593.1 GGDEF domain-containing protein [Vibrio fluvialis]EKO3477327.1 GGDEF domain-containing protein [Vibrio fluvialis]EKO3512891.1 GGDEF domain-containing protein [Vibrio fluvialis]EKO3538548.1 GGDEF domain-containing protein [Vibrio fluvialis]
MTDDDFKKSTSNLKKAVPLMMKHHVAATPANYALWYTYVDNTIPQLNQEMDVVLDNFGLCPPASGEYMYKQYIATKAETSIGELRANIELLVNEVASSMSDTMTDTTAFETIIDRSFNDLERVEKENLSIEEVMSLIRQLVSESRDIRHSTRFLNSQLKTASQEITRLKTQLAEVQKDALFDTLSGLYNRRAFDDDISALLHAQQPMSIVLLDIDHFKTYNDDFGHLFGDAVIRAIGKRLHSSCREGITAYRFGGEEFALIVPNKSLRSARQFSDALRRAIEKLSVRDRRTSMQVGNITASFGVAERDPTDTVETLIDRADKMLYEAKNLGRNRVMPI